MPEDPSDSVASQAAPPLDLSDGAQVAAVLHRAAAFNLAHPGRRGATVHLPPVGELLASGDLHDHGLNLRRLELLADLAADPQRLLLLHEVIHGPFLVQEADLSIRTLARVAALKCRYPRQVLLLLSNHELAQAGGEGILKNGHNATLRFVDGVQRLYPHHAEVVLEAVVAYVRSLPLALRGAHGLLVSHSLPGPEVLDRFDPAVLDRPLEEADYRYGGLAYQMVWGRRHTAASAERLVELFGAEVFVVGHQHVEGGYGTQGGRILILGSDTEDGVALRIDLSESRSLAQLVHRLVRLNRVSLADF